MVKEFINKMKYGEINCNIDKTKYKEFKSKKEIEEWGKINYLEWAKQYKKNMSIVNNTMPFSLFSTSIECYCGYNYIDINKYLRNIDMEPSNYKIGEILSGTLCVILSMAPRVPDNLVVYRIVCDTFIDQLIENNIKGIPTIENGFISTSLSKDIINYDENYTDYRNMLKIYVKANTIGIYVNCIAKRNEEELLLYPKGYLKLINTPYLENNKKIFECELIYFN